MSYFKFAHNPLQNLDKQSNPSTYLDFIQQRRGQAKRERTEKLFPAVDEKMIRIQDIIWQIADTKVPVLITGESGVGKEIIAKAIHKAANNDNPFVALNCAAVPETLLESQLFGYEKGAFTDAHEQHKGKFEVANNGSILLDEITEMSLLLQAKLLRVLQEKEVERLGGKVSIPINTRVMATSNQDIVHEVSQGRFRQDLYYRLYVLHIEVPPLRERPKDIPMLADIFIQDCQKSFNRPQLRFAPEALDALQAYSWPGNVRELQNAIQRAVILCSDDQIKPSDLPIGSESSPIVSLDWVDTLPIGQPLKLVETHFILETLKNNHGNRTHAARALGISLRTLRNKINEFTAAGHKVASPMSGRSLK